MARVSTVKTNFTAGELSPRLFARIDVARYQNGAKELYNFYPLVHGGARSRPGSIYVAAAKNAAKAARLIPFIFSRTQAFVLELGEQYMRFYTPDGQIAGPLEVTTPWDDTELAQLKYVQRADTMFFAHPSYAMRKLVRYSNTVWKLSQVVWDVPPSDEIGERPNTTLTLGATSGTGVTATAGGASFRASDVGRYIESGAGRAEIVGFTSTTVVTVDIAAADAFSSVGPIAADSWLITESPKVQVTPSAAGPVGAVINLTAAASAWKNFTAIHHVTSLNLVSINGGLVELNGYTSDTVVTGIVRTALVGTTAAPSDGWTLQQVVWNSVDGYPRAVGLYQQRLIAGGTTNYPNKLWGTVTGEYFNFSEGTDDADALSFGLSSDQLDAIEHLPAMKAILPLTQGAEWSIWGGVEKPLTPTNISASSETPYGCSVVRPVRVGNEVIFVDVSGKVFRAMGYRVNEDGYNSPDISVLSEHIAGDGITDMAYQRSPDKVLWSVRADGRLISCSIDRDQDAIGFASHETQGTVESVAVIPASDGKAEQLWALVARTVNGSTVRYVERFEDGLETDCCLTGEVDEDAIVSASWSSGTVTVEQTGHGYASGDMIRLSDFTPDGYDGEHEITVTGADHYTFELDDDPGATSVVGTAAKASTSWSGYGHLAGETVDVVQDGFVGPQSVVSAGGVVTLTKAAYAVEIGLHFDARIVTLPPEVATQTGTGQGNAISIHEIVVRFFRTKGGTVNGQPILSRSFGSEAVLDQPIAEFTGDRRVENLGWGRTGSGDSDGSITILRDQPLPMQVLGVITHLTVNG